MAGGFLAGETGGHTIDGDTLARHLGGEGSRQGFNGTLGGRRGGKDAPARCLMGHKRGDGDNAAAIGFLQMGQARGNQIKKGTDHDLIRAVEIGTLKLADGIGQGKTGVADDLIKAAKAVDGGGHKRVGARAREIGKDDLRRRAGGCHFVRQGAQGGALGAIDTAAGVEQQGHSGAGKTPRNGGANAAGRAGNKQHMLGHNGYAANDVRGCNL